ncbi:MAG TPA: hypothetical protein VJZ26_19375 [Blastocatellia bacterium]|nr:hypothetical protein [Blastocatellia bacterium]
MGGRNNEERLPFKLWVAAGAIEAGLLAYSQLVAYFGNESFHLLASQLINRGKRPYLDFFYQHVPLYIYLNAAWMRVFGEGWPSAHVLSALLAGGCALLVGDYTFARLGLTRRRLASATMAALLVGLNFYVVCFGTVGLPFGLCLFLIAASFRLTTESVNRRGWVTAFFAGVCAGAAAASSLLSAPVAVVLLLWMICYTRAGNRLKKCAAFLAGASIPFLPLIWLFAQDPRKTFFNIVEYHLFYRVETTESALRWNLREIIEWFASYQGLVLVPLAATGLWFAKRRGEFDARQKSELYLCAWLIAVLSVYLSLPRPTFAFYFVLLTPFAGILAAVGFYAIGERVRGLKSAWVALALVALYASGLAGRMYKSRLEILYADHKAIETAAGVINQVTPRDGLVYAFEQVYFEAKRLPPPGLENGFNPFSPGDEWLAEGRFDTVCMMANDPRIKSLDLFDRYAKSEAIDTRNFTLYVFWDRVAR